MFAGKRIVITGGTGSLGKALTRRLLSDPDELPKKIVIFSRDEAKQQSMQREFLKNFPLRGGSNDRAITRPLEFRIGDIRDYHAVCDVLRCADLVFNTAAIKQVPLCEHFPSEAVQTNVIGSTNIVRAILEHGYPVETVLGISTDKACKPVSVMGMTKAIQERILIAANVSATGTRFLSVRYGNVLASRGSVIPLFHEQIRGGGPLTITSEAMTRFLLPIGKAVDAVCWAIRSAGPGEIVVPRCPAAKIVDVAKVLIGSRPIPIVVTGTRPGEKIHEVLISEEEAPRTVLRDTYFVIKPMLPELNREPMVPGGLHGEYASCGELAALDGVRELLSVNDLLVQTGENRDDPA